MTTRMYLVRHGATPLTAEDKFSGADGVELSEEGRRQVRLLAERLRREEIGAVYASPMSRAMETARILSPIPDRPIVAVDGLREIGHGHWEGMRRSDVETLFPEEYATWTEDPFAVAPAGGESGAEVLTRALPALREIVVRHAGERVLVVSHKATIRLALCSVLGIDVRRYRDRLDQAPACLNILEFSDPAHAQLRLFNDTSHYEYMNWRIWSDGSSGSWTAE